MNTMHINTVQNVPIEYETASLRLRCIAYLIDQVILLGFLLILSALIASSGAVNQGYIFLLVNLPIYLFYTPAFEILNNGQTLGKAAMRMRVIKTDGTIPTLTDYILRWSFRLIDIIFSTGIVAATAVSSSPINQRVGGYVSNTMVIKKTADKTFNIQEVKALNRNKKEVTFDETALQTFTEDQMLLFKDTADHFEKFPNKNTRKALDEAASIMKSKLNTADQELHNLNFIRLVIKEYVMVTR